MNCQLGGNSLKGQVIYPQISSSNVPGHINDVALMALPYIGIYVGIDAFVPSKAVYGVYDPQTAGIRFIHGDGTFVVPERISFTESFSSGACRQQIHLMELYQRSAKHYQILHSSQSRELAKIKLRFASINMVKKALTFLPDLKWSPDPLPALQKIPEDYSPRSIELLQDNGMHMPCISIASNPKWDFDPKGFQARITREREEEFKNKHEEFKQKYGSYVSLLDFQHAAFCLVGLEKVGLVSFVHQPLNDLRYFKQGQTPFLAPKIVLPLKATQGWTVDCFLARFAKFEEVKELYKLVDYPNPIRWLESELETEMKLYERGDGYHLMRPWKGKVANEEVEPVVTWDILKGLEWQSPDASMEYPRSFIPQSQQPLLVSDIISPRTCKFKESRKAKEERKKQEKEARKARKRQSKIAIDLTHDDSHSGGHMNDPPGMNQKRVFRVEADADVYEADISEAVTPKSQKRNHGRSASGLSRVHTFDKSGPTQGSDPPMTQKLRYSHEFQPVGEKYFYDYEDHDGTMQRETHLRDEICGRKRLSHRSESPLKSFKRPHMWDELQDEPKSQKPNPKPIDIVGLGLESHLMKAAKKPIDINQFTPVQDHTKKQESKTVGPSLSTTSGSSRTASSSSLGNLPFTFDPDKYFNVRRDAIDSDDEPIDEIELIENPALLPAAFLPTPKSQPRRQHHSLLQSSNTRSHGSSSRAKTLNEACDAFDVSHKTPSKMSARRRDLSQDSDNAMPGMFSPDISPMPTFRKFQKRKAKEGRITSSTTKSPELNEAMLRLSQNNEGHGREGILSSPSDDIINLSSDQPLTSIEPADDSLE